MIGQTFEIYESTNNSAICSARTLNVVDSGYTSIVVVDGKIESIDTQHESVPFTPMSGGKYSHATLVANQDGTVCFEYLPYSPSPYPTDDTFTDVYVERNSNKIWAIAVLPDGSVGTFFQNDQTNGLLVFQIVSQQKSIELRIQEKTDKGYQKSLNKRFNAQSRTLTNII